ncbi:uncharacterized protein RSE6_06829 [Rhynchosporium secalis]|uniref:BTB domain-containing protein n=1 Tax=Rhynchosporium secalis TaxID=38038 RepID=A0A1E1MCC3_RHYSE|nr:uncharacterized protein RSE6_06829 [Rhynchosporium secalis]
MGGMFHPAWNLQSKLKAERLARKKKSRCKSSTASNTGSKEGPAQKRPIEKDNGPDFSTPGAIVTFYIGEEGKEFKVHKENVCAYSPVLEAAFNSTFLEGLSQTYQLKDVDPDVFRMLVQWFYTRPLKVYDIDDADDIDMFEAHRRLEEQDLHLAQLWVLADRLLVPGLQNEIVDILQKFQRTARLASTLWIPFVYENTAAGSPLRKLAVDYALFCLDSAVFRKHAQNFPPEMLLEFAMATAKAIVRDEPPAMSVDSKDICDFIEFGIEPQSSDSEDSATGQSEEDDDEEKIEKGGEDTTQSDIETEIDPSSEREMDKFQCVIPDFRLRREIRSYHVSEII